MKKPLSMHQQIKAILKHIPFVEKVVYQGPIFMEPDIFMCYDMDIYEKEDDQKVFFNPREYVKPYSQHFRRISEIFAEFDAPIGACIKNDS